MAINSAGTVAYLITASGLSIINLTAVPASARPVPNKNGTVNLGSYQTGIAPNGLISIFGQNMGASAVATTTPLPLILGGTCVTLNNIALPLFMTSAGQINAQIPPGTASVSFPLVVRSIANQAASASQQVTVSKFAPAVLVDPTGQILLFHADGSYVNKNNPANRDEPLVMYAVGLGASRGGAVSAGNPSPTTPLAVSPTAAVYFGDPTWVQAAIIVDFAGLAPGMIRSLSTELARAGIPHQRQFAAGDDRIGRCIEPEHGSGGAPGFGELVTCRSQIVNMSPPLQSGFGRFLGTCN